MRNNSGAKYIRSPSASPNFVIKLECCIQGRRAAPAKFCRSWCHAQAALSCSWRSELCTLL